MTKTVWKQVAMARVQLATYLDTLPVEAWDHISARTHWTIQELTAHIILETKYTPWLIVKYILQAHFNTNAFMDIAAKRYGSQHTPAALISELRSLTDSRAKPRAISQDEVLIDLWIHTLDIQAAAGDKSILNRDQHSFILAYAQTHPASHGLKVMGVSSKLQACTYIVTDFGGQTVGTGETQKKLTMSQLLHELINL